MSFFAAYILRGKMQAMLVASTLALLSLKIPPVSIFSSAAIALVTLRKGSGEGLLVLGFSALAAAVLGYYVIGNYQFTLGYSLVLWFPVWAISIVLREGRSMNLALDVAVLLGALIVIGFYAYFDNPAEIWNMILNRMIEPMQSIPDFPIQEVKQSIAKISLYMTGIIAAGTVSSLLLGLFLARWWQSVLFNPGGFRQEFVNLNTSSVIALVNAIIIVLAFVNAGVITQVARNILILLVVLYTFIGTAVMHVWISSYNAKRFLLPLFYVMLFIIPQLAIPIALVGFADVWLNLRNRISKQNSV